MEKYFTLGSRDEPEGLTLLVQTFDDDGNVVGGYGDQSCLYKCKEITKEEYDNLVLEVKASPQGLLLSDIGRQSRHEDELYRQAQINNRIADKVLREQSHMLLFESKELVTFEEVSNVISQVTTTDVARIIRDERVRRWVMNNGTTDQLNGIGVSPMDGGDLAGIGEDSVKLEMLSRSDKSDAAGSITGDISQWVIDNRSYVFTGVPNV